MPSETTRPQDETRTINVTGQRLRVAIRPGDGTRTPLLLMNGIGVNLEVLQQFAFQYPVRCRRLILISTGTGAFMVPGNPAALAKIATPRRYLDPCSGYLDHPFLNNAIQQEKC